MSGIFTQNRCALMGASMVALTLSIALPGVAFAQDAATAAKNDTGVKDDSVVVVTGYRKSLQTSLSQKRRSGVMLDAITADDIASFPEANLAESLQRIPGISIDRDNGEGRQISVRGLGGDFTRVRINGMEALSTSGSNDSGTSPNRSRAFDFNSFASEMFNNVQVRKSADAQTDEGSLGATVDLNTGHPFDYKGTKFAISLEDAYYENGKHQNPRIAGLYSTRWYNGKMGFLISGAYQSRDTSISNYARAAGSADYDYRGTSWAGNEFPQRAGFAAPTGTQFCQTLNTSTGAVTPPTVGSPCVNTVINNPAVIAAQTGSDPAAYAALYPTGYATPGRFDDSVVRIPALITLNDTELHSERTGITSSFQIQFDDNNRLTADYLFSSFRSESQNFQLQSVGLNRNNTNATLNTLTGTSTPTIRRGLYPGICTAVTETSIVGAQDCGLQLYGTTPVFATSVTGYTGAGVPIMGPSVLNTSTVVAGAAATPTANIYSTNPFNLDPYDYYNNPASVGYIANSQGIGGRLALIGRPSTKVLAAHVTNGTADYLQLSNVDWRSGNDASFYTTTFNQFSLNFDHRFSDSLKMVAQYGLSNSTNVNEGFLVEFNAMDRPETMTYDERGSPAMPIVNLGFDAANPNNWGIVKGFSAMRHFLRTTKSDFDQVRVDFDWNKSAHHEIRFGASRKEFTFSTDQFERLTDTLNPTEKEAGVSVASLGSVRPFGQGLDMSAGTPTSFFAPSLAAFSNVFGYDCNCINKYGDWRLTNKRSNAASFAVSEIDTGAYVQVDYNYEIFGKAVTGNLGVRQVKTQIEGDGRTTAGRPVVETNEYSDTLPSLNVNFHAMDDLYIRFAASKAMARPLLANLSPAISAISVPNDGSTTGGSLTVGNTQLKPFRSNNYDLSIEWYFSKNALLSFAAFDKEVASFPQTILFDGPLSQFLDADSIAATKAQFTTGTAAQQAAQIAYIDNNNPFTARQVRDAPGGSLWGWEANYQQDLGFLPDMFPKFVPAFVKNFGIQLNATHIDSKLQYILDPGVRVNGVQTKPQILASGPWLNASPDALNFTFYYEVPEFSARVSVSKRAGYYTTFPIAAGSCNPGLQDPTAAAIALGGAAPAASQLACDSPLLNDFVGSKSTTNVDGKVSWNLNDRLSVSLEGLNLTNQTTNRYAYPLTAQPVVSLYSSTGRQITLGVRYRY